VPKKLRDRIPPIGMTIILLRKDVGVGRDIPAPICFSRVVALDVVRGER